MSGAISRRTFLRGSLAGAVVVAGFDTSLRSWVSAAEIDRATANFSAPVLRNAA